MRTVVGQVIDRHGLAWSEWISNDVSDLFSPLRRRCWSTPPEDVRTVQSASIPVIVDNQVVGAVVHLERNERGLYAVAEVNDSINPSGELDYAGLL